MLMETDYSRWNAVEKGALRGGRPGLSICDKANGGMWVTAPTVALSDTAMENALVIGASGGIGSALAGRLEGQGVAVTRLSRSADGFDITDSASVDAGLDGLGPFDLVIVATGILAAPGAAPEKSLSAIDAAAMTRAFAVNAIGPALILRHAPRLLPRDRPARIAVLTARVGSIGDNRIGGWHSYRASKAAANMIVHGAAIELARTHKHATCVALHPGTVATPFTADYADHNPTVPPDEAARNLLSVIADLGPDDTGGFFDWAGERVEW